MNHINKMTEERCAYLRGGRAVHIACVIEQRNAK